MVRMAQALPKGVWRILFRCILALETLLYLIGFLFRNSLSHDVMAVILTIANTWTIVALFLATLTFVANVFRRWIFRRWIASLSPQKYNRIKLLLFGVGIATFTLITFDGYQRVLNPKICHYRITSRKPFGDGRDSIRIVFLSDMHLSESVGQRHVDRWVKESQSLEPDILLVGGDVFDYWSCFGYQDSIPEKIASIQAPLGSYWVMGNHEYRGDTEKKKEWIQRVGGTLLLDKVALPDSLFVLIGRDDYTQKDRLTLEQLTQQIGASEQALPRLLLDHQPHHLEVLPKNGIDLGLFGHTHNGQIMPFTLLVKMAFEITVGHLVKGDSHIVVSSGVGVAGAAMRYFTESQIVVIDWVAS